MKLAPKSTLTLLAVLLGMALGLGMWSTPAHAWSKIVLAGPEVPFPLSDRIYLPWGLIDGTWEAMDKDMYAHYIFKVQSDCNGQKILRVMHIDPATGEVIAEGVGIADQSERIIRAIMRGNGYSYVLHMSAYRNTKSAKLPKTAMVLSVLPLGDEPNAETYYILRKLLNNPYQF